MKLGYATTVDKAQGRTITSLVVDCYNFWKPGQIGVAVGRCTNKDGLQIANYNVIASELKHPQVVQDFYQKKVKVCFKISNAAGKKFQLLEKCILILSISKYHLLNQTYMDKCQLQIMLT